MITIQIPTIFWNDHYERCGDESGTVEVLKLGTRLTTVRLDAGSFDDLFSDADYYATQSIDVWCYDMRSIVSSARATLRRLKATNQAHVEVI